MFTAYQMIHSAGMIALGLAACFGVCAFLMPKGLNRGNGLAMISIAASLAVSPFVPVDRGTTLAQYAMAHLVSLIG